MRAAAALLLGLLLGLLGGMIQSFTIRVGGVAVPVGALGVLVVVVLVARACAWWAGSRLGAVTFSAGWLVATLLLGTTSSSGDLVLTSGTRQISYLVGGSLLLAAASAFPLLPEEDGVALDAPGGSDRA